jgi:hypothetical protein
MKKPTEKIKDMNTNEMNTKEMFSKYKNVKDRQKSFKPLNIKQEKTFIYIFFIAGVVLLFITFLYYEFYYLPSNFNNKKNFITILDSRNNKNNPYLFHQKFGSNSSGTIVVENGIKVKNLDNYIEYNTLNPDDCNTTLMNVSIKLNLKLPYISPNQNWHKSFRNDKNIIQFANSPIISYNPIKNKIIFAILYKDNPNRSITEKIEIDGIIEYWMDIMYVIENRIISVYLNKKLIKKHILKAVPILNFNNRTLVKVGDYNNNFNGLVNNITLYEKTITAKEIQKL